MKRGECFHCGSRKIVWDEDSTIDLEESGESILHICHCENCGATITYAIIAGNNPPSKTPIVKNERIEHGDPEAALYAEKHGDCPECGWELTETESPNFCGNCGTRIVWSEKP